MVSDVVEELEAGNRPIGVAVGDFHVGGVKSRLERQGYEVETMRQGDAFSRLVSCLQRILSRI